MEPTIGAPEAPRRRRGAQPGNTNARTSGFFARAKLTAHSRELFGLVGEGSLEDDIDLLRVEMARLVESGDYDPRALAALARALSAHALAAARLTRRDDRDHMNDALNLVLADVLAMRKST